ncbi:MAG: Transposase DDE domain-containing protein, partial [Candidatus Kentron sp. G]
SYGIESRRKNCVYILVLPPMTIQCQYHWLLSLRGGRVTPLEEQGIIPVIPPKANRKEPREYDKHIYKDRSLVECFIGKLKQFRRVFSRFDKWAKNYMNFVRFAAALIWLR